MGEASFRVIALSVVELATSFSGNLIPTRLSTYDASMRLRSMKRPVFSGDISPRYLLLGLLLAITLFYVALARDSYTVDFRAFYVAAKTTHDGLDPYRNHVDISETYADGTWLRADSRFIYPPSALLLLAPLAHFSFRHAKLLFGILIPLIMVGTLLGLQRRFPRQLLVLFALYISLPMFQNVDYGQVDCAILALVLATFYLGDSAAAGACLGVAIAIKFSPVLLLLWLVRMGRWRTSIFACVTAASLGAIAYVRWGSIFFREFLHNMMHHHEAGLPRLQHVFTNVTKISLRFIQTTDGWFSYEHNLAGFYQNPLGVGRLSHIGGPAIVSIFAIWLFFSRRARALTSEQSFFLFMAVSLLANHLLWPMGLVMCFPLLVLLVDSSPTPNVTALTLLLPMFLTNSVIGSANFSLFLLCSAFWIWQFGWFRKVGETQDASVSKAEVAV